MIAGSQPQISPHFVSDDRRDSDTPPNLTWFQTQAFQIELTEAHGETPRHVG